MIAVGQINNKRAAQAFSDYLQLKQIQHQVHTETQLEGELQLEVFQFYTLDDQVSKVSELLNDFAANPEHPKYLSASWQVSEPEAHGDKVTSWGFAAIWSSAGAVTKSVTLLCAVIFGLSYLGFFRPIIMNFGFSWDLSEPYRLITPAFIHLSTLHIIFNLMWWWYLGRQIERLLGKQTLLIVLVGTAFLANIAQALLVNNNFAGLSGVVYGLGGFVWYCGAFHKSRTLYLPNNMFGFFIIWMLLGFFEVLPVNMANWAHLFGLLAGLGLAAILVKPEQEKA